MPTKQKRNSPKEIQRQAMYMLRQGENSPYQIINYTIREMKIWHRNLRESYKK